MERTTSEYWKWTWAFDQQSLRLALQSIYHFPLSIRKDYLSCLRAQAPPLIGSSMWRSCKTKGTIIKLMATETRRHHQKGAFVQMEITEYLRNLAPLITSSYYSAVLSLGVRICPGITEDDYVGMVGELFAKEFRAAVYQFRHARFNFTTIFDVHDFHQPFSDRLPPLPSIASSIYLDFVRARSQLRDRVFLPSLGRKSVGSLVATSFWDLYKQQGNCFKDHPDSPDWVCPTDIEKLYEQTGVWVQGPIEMRQIWRYNDLAPRVYYARGGTVLQASRYVQPVMNIMIDCFPEVHRLNRFSPPDDAFLCDNEIAMIYDYASFTSLMDVIIEFNEALANFMTGTNIFLFDSRLGLIATDLGDLLRDFNRSCNWYAEFDINRFGPFDMEDRIHRHSCGMLGVQGNIFNDTLFHGIHLRFVAGERQSRCVGDDARFKYPISGQVISQTEKEYLLYLLTSIGDLSLPKMEVFDGFTDPVMQAFKYLKRPIYRDSGLLVEGAALILPTITDVCEFDDGYHKKSPDTDGHCLTAYRQICRFLRNLKTEIKVYDLDRESPAFRCLLDHIHFILRVIRKRDPEGKFGIRWSKAGREPYPIPPPSMWGQYSVEEWLTQELEYDEEIDVPRFSDHRDTIEFWKGSLFEGPATAATSFLRSMGYVQDKLLRDTVSRSKVGDDYMKMYISGQYRYHYQYEVVENVPRQYYVTPFV